MFVRHRIVLHFDWEQRCTCIFQNLIILLHFMDQLIYSIMLDIFLLEYHGWLHVIPWNCDCCDCCTVIMSFMLQFSLYCFSLVWVGMYKRDTVQASFVERSLEDSRRSGAGQWMFETEALNSYWFAFLYELFSIHTLI